MKTPSQKFRARLPWVAAATLAALLSAGVLYSATRSHHADTQDKEARPSSPDQASNLGDQTDLAVTVYNSNIALVRDVRQLTLPAGFFRLKFMDIAATVNPATVHFRSLTEPDKLGVIEQNYEYDLLEPAKLLHKYVGNDIVTGMYAESYRFPEVPANLYDRPTLLMSLDNTGARKHQIEASYLATNLSWNSDYVLTVARDDKAADLDGWVTLANNSGTAFHNARLQLVAGELNRLPVPSAPMNSRAQVVAGMVAKEQFQQEAFSEYHLYSLGRRTSVEDKETKQISLLQGTGVPVEKVFVVNGQNFYYHNRYNPGSPQKDPVMVFYKFKNEE